MYHILTGELIPHFPPTSRHIAATNAQDLNAILLALDLPRAGSVPEKKKRLRIAIGLKGNPAESA
jgi:hypothetical protein